MVRALITFFWFLFLIPPVSAQQVRHVTAAEFSSVLEKGDCELIDLRTDPEIARKGFIKGSRQIDYLSTDAETEISGLERTKTYLVYCAGGGRSAECAEFMNREGFTRVINLEKGFDDWLRKGHPAEKR
jgi:phage shock protein E